MNTTYQVTEPIASNIPAVSPDFPTQRVVERKIGRATFIVSTRFNDNKEKDIVSTIARLIEHDGGESKEKSSN